jgi:hypothetical protein
MLSSLPPKPPDVPQHFNAVQEAINSALINILPSVLTQVYQGVGRLG